MKGKNISITESLTKERMRKLKEAKEQHGFKPVWTTDGKIIFKEGDSLKFIIYFLGSILILQVLLYFMLFQFSFRSRWGELQF